jgi:uncharacterized protein YbaR (Trm112 family)
MEIEPKLLDILVCPACRESVAPLAGDAGIACRGCGRTYPVRDGIPVMLIEEAASPESPRPRP